MKFVLNYLKTGKIVEKDHFHVQQYCILQPNEKQAQAKMSRRFVWQLTLASGYYLKYIINIILKNNKNYKVSSMVL